MFPSQDHLQGATLFLAKVTLKKKHSLINIRKLISDSQAHSQWRTTYTIRHAATKLNYYKKINQ